MESCSETYDYGLLELITYKSRFECCLTRASASILRRPWVSTSAPFRTRPTRGCADGRLQRQRARAAWIVQLYGSARAVGNCCRPALVTLARGRRRDPPPRRPGIWESFRLRLGEPGNLVTHNSNAQWMHTRYKPCDAISLTREGELSPYLPPAAPGEFIGYRPCGAWHV